MQNLRSRVKTLVAKAHVTAATAAFATDFIDTLGFDGITFRANFGAGHAAASFMSLSGADSSTGLNTNTIAGSKQLATTAAKDVIIEYTKPSQRYVRADIVRGASQLVGPVWADLWGANPSNPASPATIGRLNLNGPSTGSI